MKWLICAVVTFELIASSAYSQSVRILFRPANPYFFNTQQAWDFSLLNTSASPMNVYVEIRIFKEGSFQLYHSQTSLLKLTPGENAAQTFSSKILSSDYASDDAATFFKNTSLLPAGSYSLCVWVRSAQNVILNTACNELEVKSITLPILTYPYDEQVINTTLPLLSWIPVMPQGIPQLKYVLELWEVNSKRIRATGTIASLKTADNRFQYNSSLQPLFVGKTYGWQVSAYAGSYYLGKSQTWEFSIDDNSSSGQTREEEDSIEILPDSYRVVGDETPGADYVATGILRIAYNNVAKDSSLHYTISLADNPGQYLTGLPSPVLSSGFNKIDIDLEATGLFANNKNYTLEIEDGNERFYYLNFLYQTP